MAQMKEAGKKLKEMMLADDYLAEKFRSDDESHTDIHVVSYLEWSRNAAWRERGLIFDGQAAGYRLQVGRLAKHRAKVLSYSAIAPQFYNIFCLLHC